MHPPPFRIALKVKRIITYFATFQKPLKQIFIKLPLEIIGRLIQILRCGAMYGKLLSQSKFSMDNNEI